MHCVQNMNWSIFISEHRLFLPLKMKAVHASFENLQIKYYACFMHKTSHLFGHYVYTVVPHDLHYG